MCYCVFFDRRQNRTTPRNADNTPQGLTFPELDMNPEPGFPKPKRRGRDLQSQPVVALPQEVERDA